MRRQLGLAAVLGLALGLAASPLACGSADNHTVMASAYVRNCMSDPDCVPIFEGTLTCCGAGCPNTAINVKDETHYETDVAVRTPRCSVQPPCPLTNAQVCGSQARCIAGFCQLSDATDAAADR
jgi:hypothetical protein